MTGQWVPDILKALHCLEIFDTIYPVMLQHIPQEQTQQLHYCEGLKTHKNEVCDVW